MNIFHTAIPIEGSKKSSHISKKDFEDEARVFPYRLLAAKYFIPVKYLKTRKEQRITKTRARYISTRFPSAKSSKKQKWPNYSSILPRSLRGNSKPKSTFSFSVTSVHGWFPMKWWNGEKDRGNGCVSQDLLERRSGIGGNRVRNRGESRAKITRRRNPLAPWLTEQLLFAWEELAFGSSHCSVTK